jgi:hypothetical protein
MSGFAPAWLALREPIDARTRSSELAALLARRLAHRAQGSTLQIADLGCGTGANRRFLAPLLPVPQRWSCIDDDVRLLALVAADAAGPVGPAPGVTIDSVRLDLAARLDEVLAPGAGGRAPDIVTASALLDLVSADWLAQLSALAARGRIALLFALSYDGRMSFTPGHADDALLRDLFNAHQRRDKGFGPALGPHAAASAAAAFADEGFELHIRTSDWRLDARVDGDAALLLPLLAGIAAAAREQQPSAMLAIDAWQRARLAAVHAGDLHACIGHQDMLALPPQ